MATFFSLQDGNLSNSSIYGYSLSSAEIMNNTTGTMLLTSNLYSVNSINDGSTLSAIAVHLSARSANPDGTLGLTVQRTSNAGTFFDSSSSNFTVTNVGAINQNQFSPFSPNGWSTYFNGTSDYLRLSAEQMGTNFTIEFWMLPVSATSSQTILHLNTTANSGINIYMDSSRRLNVDDGVNAQSSWTSQTFNLYQWNHVAIVKNGSTTTGYINGLSAGSNTFTPLTYTNLNIAVYTLANLTKTQFFNGFISNLRIVKNTALYASTFTPSTSPLTNISNTSLLTLQDNRFKDNSTNNLVLTATGTPAIKATSPFTQIVFNPINYGGSVYFSGSNGLQLNNNAAYCDFGTGDFTIEGWFYYPFNDTGVVRTIISCYSSWSGLVAYYLYIYGNVLSIRMGNNIPIAFSHQTSIVSNTWNHFAIVRISNVSKLYLNGIVSTSTDTRSLALNNTNPLQIGRNSDGTEPFTGYLSNIRIIKGTGLYTTNFTPSASQLTNITNTSLLLNTNNYGVISSFSETYPISGFTSYNGSNNLSTPYPQNWQILKFTNPLSIKSTDIINYTLSTSSSNQLSLMGSTTAVDGSFNNVTTTLVGSPVLTSFKPYTNFNNSYYLNGTTDWITVPATPNFVFNSDFTVECWVNTSPSVSSYVGNVNRLFGFGAVATNTLEAWFYDTVGSVNLSVGANSTIITGTIPVGNNNWHHIAVVRYNGLLKLFVDGQQSGNSIPNTTVFNPSVSNALSIGSYNNSAAGRLNGYINEFRVVNGTCVYTASSFSPPTTPLTNINNTVFLLKNGVRYDQALITSNVSAVSASLVPLDTNTTSMAFVSGISLTKSGTISGSTDSPFTDTTGLSASYYSNGGSLTIPLATNTVTLNTTFTMEFWVKPIANNNFYFFISDPTRYATYIEYNGTNIVISQYYSVYSIRTFDSSSLNIGQWNHVVICQLNGTMYLYVNGDSKSYSNTYPSYWNNYHVYGPVTNSLGAQAPVSLCYGLSGYFGGARFIQGYCLYTGTKINVPTTRPLPLPNTQAYIIEPNSGKYYFNTNITDTVNLHLGSSLLSSGIQSRNITVNSDILVDNLFVHNNANVSFNTSSSPVLMVKGLSGIQITSDGTLNVGTNSSQVPLSSTHTILLSNTQIDVHNGGNLNTYGYLKPVTTNLISDIGSSVRTFSATDSISGVWNAGDILLFKPNLSNKLSFDVLTLSSFVDSNIFTSTANSSYSHTGSATYGFIPTVYNLTRNVKINGLDSTNRGAIRAIDAAKININYTELNNFGISGTNNKNGLIIGNNSSGSTTLSGSVINSDNISNITSIVPLTGRTLQNFNIYNNIIKSNSLTLSSLSVNNINISNNYILSSSKIGLQMNNLSGLINMSNNTTVGSLSYGTYLYNNTLTGSYGALGYNSALQGTMISGVNIGTIVGGGINSAKEGVYVDATTNNLSGLSFQNIIASNNSSVGFKVSGNSLTYTNPVVLNINGLSANSNNDAGVEAYNITGNLSSLILNTNLVGNKISIGNGPTIFDGLSSTLNGNCLTILSATNYNQTIIKNAFLSSLSATGTALNMNVDKLEEFRLEGSILSANTPFKITTTRSKLEGSYMFHNSNSNVYGLSSLALTGYQSDVFKESGLVVMRENGLSANHYKYLAAGSITLDKTVVNLPNTISEKLTPWSATTKLRSTSKFIPVNLASVVYVFVLIKRSAGYSGAAPRLVAVSNPSVGISGGVLYTSVQTSGWELMSATLPATTNSGYIEFYIDCSGNVGSGYINIDSWDFNY